MSLSRIGGFRGVTGAFYSGVNARRLPMAGRRGPGMPKYGDHQNEVCEAGIVRGSLPRWPVDYQALDLPSPLFLAPIGVGGICSRDFHGYPTLADRRADGAIRRVPGD
jgi:hypothetical protein